MIAKCGQVKFWHWSHTGNPLCDPWWESETEWHREWKDQFPKAWQDVSHVDPVSGEQNIADFKNPFGLVIEFQHSFLKPEERVSREEFFKEMVWVADGTRGELDESYFNMGLGGPIQNNPLAYRVQWWGPSRLPQNWSDSNVKVFIDFGKEVLCRLVRFIQSENIGVVRPLSKSAFIEDCHKGREISISYLPEK
jgi:competence protein CoiA